MRNLPVSLTYGLLGLSCGILIAVGLYVVRASSTAVNDARHAGESYQTSAGLQSALRLLADAEAAQRTFLLSDRDADLDLYRQAREDLPRRLRELRPLLADHADGPATLDRLEALAGERFGELEESIRQRKAGGRDAAELSRAALTEFRTLIDRLEADEAQIAAGRVAIANTSARRSTYFIGVLIGGVVLLLAAAALLVRYDLQLRQQTAEALQELAMRDPLTGLMNRREFEQRLRETVQRYRRTRRPAALVLGDLDHFKLVNDTHGLPTGDAVLRWVTKHLQAGLRENDTLARHGGEEFAVILEEVMPDDAIAIVERLRLTVSAMPFHKPGPEGQPDASVPVTISFGVAYLASNLRGSAELFRRATAALEQAKAKGRDRVVVG